MEIEKHPGGYALKERFPGMYMMVGFEGGAVYAAEQEGMFYLMTNESAMADFLIEGEDDDLLQSLVKVYVFESEAERNDHLRERGWDRHRMR